MRHAAQRYSLAFLLFLSSALATAQVSLQQAAKLKSAQTAEDSLPTPPQTVESALQRLALQAAIIFTGSVTRVTGKPNGGEVEFAVEQGLRGVASGSIYRIRVSTWGGGVQRYTAGRRALFLLYAPSAAGFSSPVNGEEGIVPLSGDALVGSMDLRWIATGVARNVTIQSDRLQEPVVKRQASVAVPFTDATIQTIQNVDARSQLAISNVTGQDVHAIDRDLIIGMLLTWSVAAAGQVR